MSCMPRSCKRCWRRFDVVLLVPQTDAALGICGSQLVSTIWCHVAVGWRVEAVGAVQASLERARRQAEDARRAADLQRRQLEADLRAAGRKPASGHAHAICRSRSQQLFAAGDGQAEAEAAQQPPPQPVYAPAGSMRERPTSLAGILRETQMAERRTTETGSSSWHVSRPASQRGMSGRHTGNEAVADAPLSSYQKRLAEIRAKR